MVTGAQSLAWMRIKGTVTSDRSWQLDEGKFWGLAFSRDGQHVAYATHENGTCEIRLSDADGRSVRVIATTRDEELVSEMFGFSVDNRYLLYAIARSGAEPELWSADLHAGDPGEGTRRMARGFVFAGWADRHDAFYVWEKAGESGKRMTFRVGFDGAIERVHPARMDRSVAIDPRGELLYFSEKLSDLADDRRHIIYCSTLDGGAKRQVAEVACPCQTRSLSITVSPDGRYLHASAVGPNDSDPEAWLSFDLVIAVDGSLRRATPVRRWAATDRAIISGDGHSLQRVHLKTGGLVPFVGAAVDHFAISADGRRCAYVSGRFLKVTAVP